MNAIGHSNESNKSTNIDKYYYLDFLPEVVVVQQNGRIIYCNKEATQFLDMQSYNEIIGKSFYSFIDMGYELTGTEQNNTSPLFKETRFIKSKLKSTEKSNRDIEVKISDKKIKGEDYEFIIVEDITERTRMESKLLKKEKKYKRIIKKLKCKMQKDKIVLEKTMESDKMKTEFFSNISHELRTPLNILLSSLQLINLYMNTMESGKVISIKNYLTIMKQNCYRLLRLINNVLDLTKIDSGFCHINLKRHNIINIVEDITLSVVKYLENKNIEIIFDTEIEEKIISCDEDKIERIILNLLSNAIKFTEPGGKIEVNMYDRDCNIVISVKDTGIGIPEDKMKIIFDRFGQANKDLSKNKEGTGIGLSLVKDLVEMHKGRIEVQSADQGGTEFLVYIPNAMMEADKAEEHTISNLNSEAYERKMECHIERMNIEFSDIYS